MVDRSVKTASVFKYEKPSRNRGKAVSILCRSDLLISAVQVVGDGGETNLHAHRDLDGFWFVLAGRARFYTTDDALVGELGPSDGVLLPRGYPYWFEKVGDDDLEILQVQASSKLASSPAAFADGRINFAAPRDTMGEEVGELFDESGDSERSSSPTVDAVARSDADPQATCFRYERPERTRAKAVAQLCHSDLLLGAVQVVGEGGETNLHSHSGLDGFWFVLSGHARFYTKDDEVIADLAPLEGVLVPRSYPYWFEKVGEGDLEILQVEVARTARKTFGDFARGRIDYTPQRASMGAEVAEIFGRPGR